MFNFFKKKKEKHKDLKEILAYIRELEENIENLSQGLQNVKKVAVSSLQKVGIVRYNPFNGVGGDQSFSIALLDSNSVGFVITSLYSREGTRVYAKPVENGTSGYQLSDEEKEAIGRAMGV